MQGKYEVDQIFVERMCQHGLSVWRKTNVPVWSIIESQFFHSLLQGRLHELLHNQIFTTNGLIKNFGGDVDPHIHQLTDEYVLSPKDCIPQDGPNLSNIITSVNDQINQPPITTNERSVEGIGDEVRPACGGDPSNCHSDLVTLDQS